MYIIVMPLVDTNELIILYHYPFVSDNVIYSMKKIKNDFNKYL